MFYLLDVIKMSVAALTSNKRRALLTILGIVIGITAVIVIMAVGAGAQSLVVGQVNNFGSNLVGVLPGGSGKNDPPSFVFGIVITTLKSGDVEAISRQVASVVAASGIVSSNEVVSWEGESRAYGIFGCSAEYNIVGDVELANGRWFSVDEEKGLGRVAVLGSGVPEELFGETNPLGQKIKIKKETFTVIGVAEPKGSSFGQNMDDQVYLPISSAQKLILGIDYLNFARVKIDQAENVSAAVAQMEEILRDQHNIDNPDDDDFSVRDQAQALDLLKQITDYLRFFLAAVAAIALLVGGIGIMNIMLVSVTERTREIGLRKAVGAREGQILAQFLLEAVFLTSIAGVLGIIFGAAIAGLISVVMNYLGYTWQLIISSGSILVAVGVAAVIGLVFGYYPAYRAAKLDPIDALR